MLRAALRSTLVALAASFLLACGADGEPTAGLAPAREHVSPGPRALVTRDGGLRVVLRAGVEASMAQGDFALLSAEAPMVVRRGVHREGLTTEELRWIGHPVVLHNEQGVVCSGVVEDVEIVGRLHPHDGLRMDWFNDDGRPKFAPEDMAELAWSEAPDQGSVDLTGRIRVTQGDCDGAVWAQFQEDEIPPAAAAEPASPELRALALAAARATEDYRQAQEQYEQFKLDAPEQLNAAGLPARWEDYNGTTSVTLIAHPNGETLVATSLQAGEGCGDFLGSAFQLWRLHGETLEPLPSDAFLAGSMITGAVDVDGDDHLDLLTPSGYVRQTATGFDDPRTVDIPLNEGCGC
jgi:hypothetical protein